MPGGNVAKQKLTLTIQRKVNPVSSLKLQYTIPRWLINKHCRKGIGRSDVDIALIHVARHRHAEIICH